MRPALTGIWGGRAPGGSWRVASAPAGAIGDPGGLAAASLDWVECAGPMTAAAALDAAELLDRDRGLDFDASDWWFEGRFAGRPGEDAWLRCDGIATVADLWLNGRHLGSSDNMFTTARFRLPEVTGDDALVIRCRALAGLPAPKTPRRRWKTMLVSDQQLRWRRTTLLGRIPAWCPAIAPVGPWRPIRLEPDSPVTVTSAVVETAWRDGTGLVTVTLDLEGEVTSAELSVGAVTRSTAIERQGAGVRLVGTVELAGAERWWPHTHGPQPRYPASISLVSAGERVALDLGRIGFRSVTVDRGSDGRGFGLVVNDVPVFARGACWTPLDLVSLRASPESYRAALVQCRDAGMNMIRVGGTMVYEDDAFYEACDDLGIMVWQDVMLANMDYPAADPGFAASMTREAVGFLERMAGRPCLTVICGGSEVEQQAAMMGRPAPEWANPLTEVTLPELVATRAPGVVWVRSSPTGGPLPFQVDHGPSHYYGVGAYLRPLEDARRANVRFTSECLGFANVPEPAMVERVLEPGAAAPHDPAWKAGVPRDRGAGWDFEDVRDHYLKTLFGVDPAGLRYQSSQRYLALGRVTTGEVIQRTVSEWRRPGSTCRGALVWFHRDLRPGAGWGLVDSSGDPKAAWWYFRRAATPVALILSDEGLNGLRIALVNERPESIRGRLHLAVIREGTAPLATAEREVEVAARDGLTIDAASLLDGFLDLTWSYRFGPLGHDAVVVRFEPSSGDLATLVAVYRPAGLPSGTTAGLELSATAEATATGYRMAIRSTRIAHAVRIEAPGFHPDDNYFDLPSDMTRTIELVGSGPLDGIIEAVNGPGPVPIRMAA